MCLMEHQHNEEEKAMFRLMTKALYKIWREDLGFSCPPKLHALVGHAPDQLDEFGNLADWAEERTEHLHHDVNVWERVWANTKWNWERKQNKIYETLEQGSQAGVVQEISVAMGRKEIFQKQVSRSKAKRLLRKKTPSLLDVRMVL